jgi:hypothetical protein
VHARLGSGAPPGPTTTATLHNRALPGHLGVGAVLGHHATRNAVVAGDKYLALIPNQEAGAVHNSVGVAPEWVGVIG